MCPSPLGPNTRTPPHVTAPRAVTAATYRVRWRLRFTTYGRRRRSWPDDPSSPFGARSESLDENREQAGHTRQAIQLSLHLDLLACWDETRIGPTRRNLRNWTIVRGAAARRVPMLDAC